MLSHIKTKQGKLMTVSALSVNNLKKKGESLIIPSSAAKWERKLQTLPFGKKISRVARKHEVECLELRSLP